MLYPVMAFGSSILVGKVVITTFPWVSSSLIFLLYLYVYESISLFLCVIAFGFWVERSQWCPQEIQAQQTRKQAPLHSRELCMLTTPLTWAISISLFFSESFSTFSYNPKRALGVLDFSPSILYLFVGKFDGYN